MIRLLRGAFVFAVALGLLPFARALVVFNHSTTDDRFQSGTFPSGPVANSSFFLASYNFSGVGWQSASTQFAVTMVSPLNFVAARHAAPIAGASVSFLGQDGLVHSYTVASVSTIQYSPGVLSDLVVGTLSATVSPSVTYYPSLFLGNSAANYLGLNLAVYGQGGTVGLNSISAIGSADFIPFDGVADSVFAVMDYDSVSGGTTAHPAATQGQSGDSSSPSFVLVGGNLAVVGVHSAINGAPPPEQTYDTFIPAFLTDVDGVLQTSGYHLQVYTAVPEPANAGFLAACAAALGVIIRRRRRR